MTRAIAILAACAAVAVWLLRRRGDGVTRPEQPDPMDGVQGDPGLTAMLLADADRDRRLVREWDVTLPSLPSTGGVRYGTGDWPQWTYSSSDGTQPPYIDNPVLVRMRDQYRGKRSAQSADVTTEGMS